MRHFIISIAVVSSLFSSECATIFPDVLSSESAIIFESRLNIDSKESKLQTPILNQSRLKSKCDGAVCKATDTTPNSLKAFDFKRTSVDDTEEVSEDKLYDKENIPSIVITKDNTVITFKAPAPSEGFTPIQKIGSLKVEAKNVTIVFEAGDYYIKSFEAQSSMTKQRGMHISMSDTLTITPNANTRLFIDEYFTISKSSFNPMSKSLLINAKAETQAKKLSRFMPTNKEENKDSKKLIIYSKGNIEIDASYEINALIYGYSDITLSSDAQSKYRGAIHAKGELTLGKEYIFKTGEFVYDEEAVGNLWKFFSCQALPNEVNEKLNNSTLLGIDDNRNGVRDDVERWIIDKYKNKHPIYIDIAMQAANAYKKVLEMPERAVEIHDEVSAPSDCMSYYKIYAKYFNEPLLVETDIITTEFIKKIYFNTSKRITSYQQYDSLLSGGVYSLPKIEEMKTLCHFNTKKYEEK